MRAAARVGGGVMTKTDHGAQRSVSTVQPTERKACGAGDPRDWAACKARSDGRWPMLSPKAV
eukprot:7094637-Prymnesium_polylepis.1